jgi:hypothetical protein
MDELSDRKPKRRLRRRERELLETVCAPGVSDRDRDLLDARYPWQQRRYYPHPAAPTAVIVGGALMVVLGGPVARGVGVAIVALAAITGLGPSAVRWIRETLTKRRFNRTLVRSVPAFELEAIAEDQPDLGLLIWRAQQAVDGINDSEARAQDLLRGLVSLDSLAEARYQATREIAELADERDLLAPADGRAALDELLRPRREAAAARLVAITASVEQLEGVGAEVALLDEHLADLRIAEQILGTDSTMLPELAIAQADGLEGAAAGVRAVREFVIQHHLGGAEQ